MNKKLLICDFDELYSMKLGEFIRKSECCYEVSVFSSVNKLLETENFRNVSVILMELDFYESFKTKFKGDLEAEGLNIYYLLEDRADISRYDHGIYKYQSAAVILDEIDVNLSNCRVMYKARDGNEEIIGVYSPISHSLKTSFALMLSKVKSENMKMLYINMEGYNGLSRFIGGDTEYSLSNLIYEYSLDKNNFTKIFKKYVKKYEGFYFITPARTPLDLIEIDGMLWISLFKDIVKYTDFKGIVIDIGDSVRGLQDILNICREIYMPFRKDTIALSKLKDYEDALRVHPNGNNIMQRTKKIRFPYFDDMENSLFDLENSKLRKYVKRMVG